MTLERFILDDEYSIVSCLLEIRWLVVRIWISTCLEASEGVYDQHNPDFERIMALATLTQLRQSPPNLDARKFSFAMGFCPLLHFVMLKCRFLELRLKALALLKSLSFVRESLWDSRTLYATGKRVIEIEHHIVLPSETHAWPRCAYISELPKDEQRIRDNMARGEIQAFTKEDGTRALRQKICFLMLDNSGALESVIDWVTIAPWICFHPGED